jgi:transaldolase
MRLTRLFGADVSVELHTDVSYDAEDIVHYGRRFHAINPDRFIVKVPFTPAGILGARRLRDSGIRVNLTLGFSARQNAIAALVAKPNFVNVFLGRLNSFVADNNLGSGKMVGEKATLASQRTVTRLTASYETPVRQIAASIRGAGQIEALAGVDVFTMPTHVAEQARSELSGTFKSHVEDDYPVALDDANADEVKLENLWEVGDAVIEFARQIDADPPASGSEVRNAAHEAGCRDLFPRFSEKDLAAISEDGKIPVHERWAKRIASGEVAVDTLMNRAGLATFASDQAALDNRIRDIVS